MILQIFHYRNVFRIVSDITYYAEFSCPLQVDVRISLALIKNAGTSPKVILPTVFFLIRIQIQRTCLTKKYRLFSDILNNGHSLRHQQFFLYFTNNFPNALNPPNNAFSPSSSSMHKRRLYFATRSERLGAPVLI